MSNERERALDDHFAEAQDAIEHIQGALRHRQQPQDVTFHRALKAIRDGRALLASSPPPSCERMEDALHMIKQWADAYPVDVFRPISDEKLKEANEALKAIGVDMGALHAGWARHIVDGIGNIARAALDASRTEEKS